MLYYYWVQNYQCDIEILLQFKYAEVGSRGERKATMCNAYVGRTIYCKPNTSAWVLNRNRL